MMIHLLFELYWFWWLLIQPLTNTKASCYGHLVDFWCSYIWCCIWSTVYDLAFVGDSGMTTLATHLLFYCWAVGVPETKFSFSLIYIYVTNWNITQKPVCLSVCLSDSAVWKSVTRRVDSMKRCEDVASNSSFDVHQWLRG